MMGWWANGLVKALIDILKNVTIGKIGQWGNGKMGNWGYVYKKRHGGNTELEARASSGLQTLSHPPQTHADGKNDNNE